MEIPTARERRTLVPAASRSASDERRGSRSPAGKHGPCRADGNSRRSRTTLVCGTPAPLHRHPGRDPRTVRIDRSDGTEQARRRLRCARAGADGGRRVRFHLRGRDADRTFRVRWRGSHYRDTAAEHHVLGANDRRGHAGYARILHRHGDICDSTAACRRQVTPLRSIQSARC